MNLFEKSKARGISSPYAKDFMAYDEVDGKIRVVSHLVSVEQEG